MRGFTEAGQSLRAALATWRADVRQAHPTTVLRWLRAGVLAMVATTALLYLVVSTQAGHRIAAARHTDRAIDDIVNAQDAASAANTTLKPVFTTGQVALIGTGTEFANDTARINTELTSAVEGNAAGRQGLTLFQFVQGQLTTCLQLAESAVRDYSRIAPQSTGTSTPSGTGAGTGTGAGMGAGTGTGTGAGTSTTADLGGQIVKDTLDALNHPEETYRGQAVARTGGLIQTLADLKTLEQDALARQRHSAWLDPAVVWPLLVGPSAVMLLLVLATGSVLARHFRRPASRRLLSALLVSTGVGVVTAVLVGFDAHDLATHPRAVHPVTLTVAPALLAAAAVLAYLAYRPRLAEYRFPRPGAAS